MTMGNLLERPDQAIFPDRRTDRAAVYELVRSLSLLVDPDALLEKVGEGLRHLFRADLVLVLLREVEQGDFTPCYSLGYDSRVLAGVGMSGRGRLARRFGGDTHCLDLADRLELQEHIDPAEQELLARLKVQLCLPLVSLGRLIGMILLGSTDSAWHLARESRELLEILGAQVALALENAVLHSRQSDRLRRLYRAERLATAGRLAASVAHEIRNPLTVISSTVEYILRGISEDDPRRGLTEAVLHEVARINRTVEGLLSLGRVREVRESEVDLLKPLEQARLLVEGQARAKGVRLDNHYGRRLMVYGDADQLQQVFLNLLLNALEATDPGGRIAIRVEALEDPPCPTAGGPVQGRSRRVQVEISDTGRGIKRADLDRIFEPFFTTRSDGSGLGLAICQSIVERHEGEIDIRSKPGQGTTVRVCLPRLD
jgi:two-component system, NtrC family, sensor kinase